MNILVCGDSHSQVFNYCNNTQNKYHFNVCSVGGATAQGAVNPSSKTNALPIFIDKIARIKSDKFLVMLGEVDCGYVIWVRSKRYNISVDEQIENSVNNLFQFIGKSNYKNEDIIVAGSVLPTIKDNTDKKFLCGARSEVDINQKLRTDKTLEYNNILRERCVHNNYNYIDITSYIIGDDGIVKSEYCNKNPYDHHLDNDKTWEFWIKELNNIT